MKHFLHILLFSILTCLPFASFAQSTDPNDYDIDYGCWGNITIEVGATTTVSHQYPTPYPSKVKSIVWTSGGPDFCAITSQSQSSCTIKGVYPVKNLTLWCLMVYGETTYQAYYNVNVIKSSSRIKISANPSGGEVMEGSKVYLTTSPEDAKIYYTLDGSTPTINSTRYGYDGITINENCTLKAFATGYTYADSEVFTATYTTAFKKGATFTDKTVEGIDMTFKVLDATNKTVQVSSVDKNASGNVTIPSEIIGYKITEIAYDAFYSCKGITSVSIPNSVTSIGYEAFKDCSSLTSITIPNSVTSIELGTFEGCSSLESVNIPNSVTTIKNYAFWGCSSLESVNIPNSVTTIKNYAFSGCNKLEEVSLPTSLTRLESGTFFACNSLTKLNAGNKIEYIGTDAITNCPWTQNLPDGMNFLGKVLLKYKGEIPANTTINIPAGCTQIYDGAITGKEGLVGVNIPASVTHIASGALQNCPNLQTITVDASNSAYDSRNNCNAVIETATNTLIQGCSSTTIPTNVTSIGASAFYGNWTKDEILIPNQIDSIAVSAFRGNSNVKSILIGKGLRKIGSYAFAQLPQVKEITVATGNTYFDSRNSCNAIIQKKTNTLVVGCSGTTIPNTVKTIGEYAFCRNGGESFNSLVIPNSVEEIKEHAFEYLSHLRNVSIGANVRTFGNYIFYGCKGLEAIESLNGFPDDIDEKVFNNGSKDFSIYDNVTLYVPVGCRNNFRLAAGWSNFKNIVEGTLENGIGNIFIMQSDKQVIYSPAGIRLSAPQHGINIINGKKHLVR